MTSGFNLDGGIHEVPLPGVSGRLWLCGKHRIGPDVRGTLAATGAELVVCLTERHELAERYPEYVAWLDRARIDGTAIWFPIHDLSAPAVEPFSELVDRLVGELQAGRSMIVHCAAGVGRTGTTAVAILIALGASLDDALVHVRTHRPLAGPEVGAQRALVERLASPQSG